LGDCLPVCPKGAISFVEREALPYNEEEVKKNVSHGGCPGKRIQHIRRDESKQSKPSEPRVMQEVSSQLRQWPVQIQLVPVNAPYFDGADLLIAADCTAYACGDFHSFMRNKISLIGCPKLDDADYAGKLTDILANNDIRSITVIRMEVPCCGGIVNAVQTALKNSGKIIPWRIITISIDGNVIE
jgi:ferredoxin